MTIKFGTDGWRAKIADGFTFKRLAKVALGVARTCLDTYPYRRHIYIGYDRRFLSEDFAKMTASVFASEGFQVFLTSTYMPTPVLSFKAKQDPKAAGAIVITASHNPPDYNGFKFKQFHGCSALQATTDAFETKIKTLKDVEVPSDEVFKSHLEKRKIIFVDLIDDYKQTLFSHIDTKKIKAARFRVGVDAMYGSGSTFFREILESLDVEVTEIHAQDNPNFGGIAPEPVEKNLKELASIVKKDHLDCGFATDGDGDRLGAIDKHGNAFTTQMILSVFYWHMLKNKHKKWNIARSVSTTQMVDLIAQAFGQTCIETPVGFKFIAEHMVAGKAQVGGEESGGVGIKDYIPERDGIFTALMLLEMMATEQKSLSEIYACLCAEIRPYQFKRLDLHLPTERIEEAMVKLQANPPQDFAHRKVDRIEKMDGMKFYLEDGSWVLIRPSGTEPLFRLYAEAEDLNACNLLLESAQDFLKA